jgi:hypothetical protein
MLYLCCIGLICGAVWCCICGASGSICWCDGLVYFVIRSVIWFVSCCGSSGAVWELW